LHLSVCFLRYRAKSWTRLPLLITGSISQSYLRRPLFTMSSGACNQFAVSGTCSYGERCKFRHIKATTSVVQQTLTKRKPNKRSTANPIDEFFAQYQFPYDSSQPSRNEFYRMCDSFGWERGDQRETAYRGLKDAMVLQFNSLYGTNENDIGAWNNLCQVLQIAPIPEGLELCRETVKNTHVNIVDLVDTPNTGNPVVVFKSEQDLSEYTKATGKYFPRDNAYAGGVLRFLLRHIENPRVAVPKRTRGKDKKRR